MRMLQRPESCKVTLDFSIGMCNQGIDLQFIWKERLQITVRYRKYQCTFPTSACCSAAARIWGTRILQPTFHDVLCNGETSLRRSGWHAIRESILQVYLSSKYIACSMHMYALYGLKSPSPSQEADLSKPVQHKRLDYSPLHPPQKKHLMPCQHCNIEIRWHIVE